MGLNAYGDLGHRQISKVFPNLSYPPNLNFEFDFFILFGETCLVGELSGLSGKQDLEDKYQKFCKNFSILKNAENTSDVFKHFSIPEQDRYLFAEVQNFKAFFIAEKHERFDVKLDSVQDVSIIYKNEWVTSESYVEAIGHYASSSFLKILGINKLEDQGRDLRLEENKNNLMRLPGKRIVKGSDMRVDVFTFVASPADLLSISEVFRRELMPVITSNIDGNYQRPLVFKKLNDMRDLVSDPDFMFPNSILVALNENCDYDSKNRILNIPLEYGAVSVIDGQHRLFSYASTELPNELRENAKILVTALKYRTDDPKEITRCSATTFVDINQKQKRISSSHIDEIAYSVLRHTTHRALAAQIILRLNHSSSNPWSGLFSSLQATQGIIKAATVIGSLSTITNLNKINGLATALSGKRHLNKRGYEILFGVNDITELSDAEVLIEKGFHCLIQYFVRVRKVFNKDWTQQGISEESTLRYTKVFAALIKLLGEFVKEGLDWNDVEEELKKIKKNILQKRNLSIPHGVVLKKDNKHIPDDQPTMFSSYQFLSKNRNAPVSIQDIK